MTQSKITVYLQPKQEIDSDCFIIEPGDKKGVKMSDDPPTDSAVVFTATPKRHPKIYDDDDDDEPLATPQGQKSSAAKRDVTATKRRRGQTAARKPSNLTRSGGLRNQQILESRETQTNLKHKSWKSLLFCRSSLFLQTEAITTLKLVRFITASEALLGSAVLGVRTEPAAPTPSLVPPLSGRPGLVIINRHEGSSIRGSFQPELLITSDVLETLVLAVPQGIKLKFIRPFLFYWILLGIHHFLA
jgi:hypothetical protein